MGIVLKKSLGGYQSGQLGRTVNPLSYDFAGSNPAPPTVTSVALAKEVGDVHHFGDGGWWCKKLLKLMGNVQILYWLF